MSEAALIHKPEDVMTVSDSRYYDLEAYLFEDVHTRFHAQGSIGAFDFFSIVIWKANRAKSVTARRLLRRAALPGESLDSLCHRLTRSLHQAPSDEARFLLLVGPPWDFALPMASAILSVLYSERFTVYDYRVCGELADFQKLINITDGARLWAEYQRFVTAVRQVPGASTLREKDRILIGRSMASQLRSELEDWSRGPLSAAT